MSEIVKRLEAIIPYWPTHEQDLWDAIAEIKRLTRRLRMRGFEPLAQKERSVEEDEFEPTCVLRIFGVSERLQQRWRRPRYAPPPFGHLEGWDYEWRSIPHVYGEDK